MGEVYLARHPRLPRQDALKVLRHDVSADGEYRERFNREADIAAALWHPHIVGVHDRGEFDGQLWISMDYVDGTDASRLLGQRYPDGMPANILLANPQSDGQRIVLADFGIARWADDPSGLTATNMTVGTVSYAAPEQLMGDHLDGRADQYALAATAFHLLTGSPPFQHTNPAVVISQHLSASPPAIGDRRPDLSALDPVLAKALAKKPNDRFERCSDFARALGHRLGDAPPDATRLSPAAADVPRAGRSPMRPAVVVAAVLAILLVAAIGFALVEMNRADDERAAPSARTTAVTPKPPAATSATSGVTPLPPPPEPPPATTSETTVETATSTAAAAPVAVIGADCSPLGGTGTTANGSTAYCSTLQNTGATIWSLSQGEVPSPTVTTEPTDEPLPTEEESPVRVCMQQTGQTRRQCREDIRRSNGLP
jgi:serine/threonine-protein kinase